MRGLEKSGPLQEIAQRLLQLCRRSRLPIRDGTSEARYGGPHPRLPAGRQRHSQNFIRRDRRRPARGLGFIRDALDGHRGFSAGRVSRLEGLEQCREFQFLQQRGHPFRPRRREREGLGIELDRRRPVNRRQLPTQPRLLGLLRQQGSRFGRGDVVHMGQQILNGAELCNEFDGRLFADALHARNVVRTVSHQPHDFHHARRLDAEALQALRFPGPLVFHGVEDADLGREELKHVLVARDDDNVVAGLLGLHGQGADEVIRLIAGDAQARNVEGLDHAVNVGNLRLHAFRHGRALGFIVLEGLVAERWPLFIEGHRQAVRLVLADDLQERGREAVNRVRLESLAVGKRGQGEEGPVDVGAAVDEIQGRHGDRLWARGEGREFEAGEGDTTPIYNSSTYCLSPLAPCLNSNQSPATMSGGFSNFARSLLIASRTDGWPISLRSSRRLPGKSSMEMPISIVRIPCPGKKSMAKPAKRNTTPITFLTTWPTIWRTGWWSCIQVRGFRSSKKSSGSRTRMMGMAIRLPTNPTMEAMVRGTRTSVEKSRSNIRGVL